MKEISFLALLFLGSLVQGQVFPELVGELLSSEVIELPKDCKGKYTLVGLAYSQKAEEELRTWYDPSIDKFILKSGMFDSDYDVNIYFIPMFHGVTSLSYENSFKKVKSLTDKQLYNHVVFYKGEIKGYKEELELGDKEHPDFFLIDPKGKIIEHFTGRFKEIYFEKIVAYIDANPF